MRLLILECNAEELKANRTVLDNVSDAISSFTEALCGAKIDLSKVDLSGTTEPELDFPNESED